MALLLMLLLMSTETFHLPILHPMVHDVLQSLRKYHRSDCDREARMVRVVKKTVDRMTNVNCSGKRNSEENARKVHYCCCCDANDDRWDDDDNWTAADASCHRHTRRYYCIVLERVVLEIVHCDRKKRIQGFHSRKNDGHHGCGCNCYCCCWSVHRNRNHLHPHFLRRHHHHCLEWLVRIRPLATWCNSHHSLQLRDKFTTGSRTARLNDFSCGLWTDSVVCCCDGGLWCAITLSFVMISLNGYRYYASFDRSHNQTFWLPLYP